MEAVSSSVVHINRDMTMSAIIVMNMHIKLRKDRR